MEKVYRPKVYDAEEIKDYRHLIARTVKQYPDNIAYKFKHKISKEEFEYVNVTYAQFDQDIKALATSFLEMGLENKKVAVIGENRYEWCTTYLAVTTGGMTIVPLDKALPENEIESLVLRSGIEAIVFEKKYEDILVKIKEEGNSKLEYLISMDAKVDTRVLSYSKILNKGRELLEKGDNRYEAITIDPEEMSIMLFTSGTTSEPKAVMLSQQNICANIRGVASYVTMYPTDTLLSFLPLHHTFECTITFLYGIYFGVTVAFCDGLKYIQKNLEEYKVTVFVAVPLVLENMYKKITKAIEEKGKTKLINTMSKVSKALLKCKIDLRKVFFKQILDQFGGNLRVVFYGAAPMDKNTIIGFNNLGVELVQGYGLTETSPVISAETDKNKRPGSVGLPLYNVDIKIENKDEEGTGEIVVKGPSIMMGYYQNEEATKKVLKNGWFNTGDYGYIDEDGFLYVTGRKNDVIVLKNGKNIYPQEIEFLIGKLPYIEESMVYEKPRKTGDTLLGAKLVYNQELIEEILGKKEEKEYETIIWEEIKKINKTLPTYKHIKEILITTEPLSKTTTQKLKRHQEMKKIKAKHV